MPFQYLKVELTNYLNLGEKDRERTGYKSANEMGQDEWEMMGTWPVPDTGGYCQFAVFKREVDEDGKPVNNK